MTLPSVIHEPDGVANELVKRPRHRLICVVRRHLSDVTGLDVALAACGCPAGERARSSRVMAGCEATPPPCLCW